MEFGQELTEKTFPKSNSICQQIQRYRLTKRSSMQELNSENMDEYNFDSLKFLMSDNFWLQNSMNMKEPLSGRIFCADFEYYIYIEIKKRICAMQVVDPRPFSRTGQISTGETG